MRDVLVTAIVLGLLPIALFRPFVGVALWTWISVMNPHRLTWSFAYDLPFAQIIAVVTLIGLIVAWKSWRFPVTSLTIVLAAFSLWMTATLFFSLHYQESVQAWMQVAKMLLMTFVAAAVVRSEKQVISFIWILTLSVTYFGIKGGLFVLLTGGEYRVWGPPETQIGDNNALSVALVMMIPLLVFLAQYSSNKFVRAGVIVSILLSAVAVLGSYSRGAFVAICAMLFFLALKNRKQLAVVAVILVVAPIAFYSMPEQWANRVRSIAEYDADTSVLGRFNAWGMAWNLARDKPLVGGGFEVDDADVFARYATNPDDIHSAHSIYFQMLGQHGFVGLALFLALGFLMWRTGNRILRLSRNNPTIRWHGNLARALQVSLIGFAIGGITVNIGYWDVIYFELVVMVALERLTVAASDRELAHKAHPAPGTAGAMAVVASVEPRLR